MRRKHSLPLSTIQIHSIDKGILLASLSLDMPNNSDWNSNLVLLTRARAASFSFLQSPPNPAPAAIASVRALRENNCIKNPCHIQRFVATAAARPFQILNDSCSRSHVSPVYAHTTSPLPPPTWDNIISCSMSISSISFPVRSLYV